MKIFCTSDTHFSHRNIIQYCNRPYPCIDIMNSAIIKNWNSVISDDDIVLFLGDFCFAKTAEAFEVTQRFASALHGQKFIVKGNHDFQKFRYVDAGFIGETYQMFDFDRFLFVHRPDDLVKWTEEYDFVFFGHVHDKDPEVKPLRAINVCLDANNMMPIDITDYFTKEEREKLKKLLTNNKS